MNLEGLAKTLGTDFSSLSEEELEAQLLELRQRRRQRPVRANTGKAKKVKEEQLDLEDIEV